VVYNINHILIYALHISYLTFQSQSHTIYHKTHTQDDNNNKEPTKEEQQEVERIKQLQIAKQLPQYKSNYDLFHTSVTTNGDLRNFYYLACGEEQTLVELQDEEEESSSNGQGGGGKGSGRKFSFEDPIVNNSDKQQNGDNKKKKNRKKKKNKNTNNTTAEVSASSGSENETTNKNNNNNSNQPTAAVAVTTNAKYLLDIESQLAKLNAQSCIPMTIVLSGYNPPPSHRSILGDLAYLVVTLPDNSVVHVTAIPQGFYINKSTEKKFDPTPDIDEDSSSSNNQDSMACYSHSLLDTLLQKSKSFRTAYTTALLASKQRSELLSTTSINESTLYNFFRPLVSPFSTNNLCGSNTSLVGGLLAGLVLNSSSSGSSSSGTFSSRIDMVTVKPSWLVPPLPSVNCSGNGSIGGSSGSGGSNIMLGKKLETYNHSTIHEYSTNRLENELMNNNMYGMDIRGGGLRDWNEELQVARELSVSSFGERVDRAR